MKRVFFFILLVLVPTLLQVQFKPAFDKKISLNQNSSLSRQMSMNEINRYSDLVPNPNQTSIPNTNYSSLTDTTKYDMYGDLLNDNPSYNEKISPWMVALRVTLANVTTFAIDRYIYNYEFTKVGFNSWKHNIRTGWEWDIDRFGMNYFFHPFSGAMYFNAACANVI